MKAFFPLTDSDLAQMIVAEANRHLISTGCPSMEYRHILLSVQAKDYISLSILVIIGQKEYSANMRLIVSPATLQIQFLTIKTYSLLLAASVVEFWSSEQLPLLKGGGMVKVECSN